MLCEDPGNNIFVGADGTDRMKEEIEANYKRVKAEVSNLIEKELERIKNDPDLQHLISSE